MAIWLSEDTKNHMIDRLCSTSFFEKEGDRVFAKFTALKFETRTGEISLYFEDDFVLKLSPEQFQQGGEIVMLCSGRFEVCWPF